MTDKKLTTAKQMRSAIGRVPDARAIAAQQSQYDRRVCVRAVGAARDVFERIAIKGTSEAYGRAVLLALEPFYNDYNDTDGEYTSGKAAVGDVYYDICRLLDD